MIHAMRGDLESRSDAQVGLLEAAALFAQADGWKRKRFVAFARGAFEAATAADQVRRRVEKSGPKLILLSDGSTH